MILNFLECSPIVSNTPLIHSPVTPFSIPEGFLQGKGWLLWNNKKKTLLLTSKWTFVLEVVDMYAGSAILNDAWKNKNSCSFCKVVGNLLNRLYDG